MDYLSQTGKKRTIQISISIILVSLHTIFFYHSAIENVETKKVVQQIIRFLLTVVLLIMLYKGKKWAQYVAFVLFSIAAISAFFKLFELKSDIVLKIPVVVMTLVYSLALYHFGFSKSYKAFAENQQIAENERIG